MQTQRPSDRVAALLLAAIAGAVDAVAFIEFGGFFVAFMSGNSTRLGLALGMQDWSLALFAAGLVALFVGGVAAGQLIGARFGRQRGSVLLAIEAVLLAAAATLYARGLGFYAPPLMAAAMGLSNAVLAQGSMIGVGVSYMTGTLARVGTRLAALTDRRDAHATPILLDLALWLAFVAGAAAGAIGDQRFGGAVLELPAFAALLLALWRWNRG